MNATKKQLPPVLQNLINSSPAAKAARKFFVLCVGQGQAFNDGVVVALPDGHDVQQVPYHEGGGWRTAAAAYVVKGFDGCTTIRVVRPELAGFPYTYSAESLAVACTFHEEKGAL